MRRRSSGYGNGHFFEWLMDREITPYMPTRDAVGPTRSPFYGPESFTYLPEGNTTSACKPAAELRRTQRGEPNVRLYRDAREVRSVQTEIPRPGHFAILLFG